MNIFVECSHQAKPQSLDMHKREPFFSPAWVLCALLSAVPTYSHAIQFTQSEYSANEGHRHQQDANARRDLSEIIFKVEVADPARGVIAANLATSSGTARQESSNAAGLNRDYAGIPNADDDGVLAFASGSLGTQEATVNISGDDRYEKDRNFTATLSNPSSGTTLGALSTATGLIMDDDGTTGLVLTGADGEVLADPAALTVLEGETVTYMAALTSQPTAPVTVGVAASNASRASLAPSRLTFTADNWNKAQAITVSVSSNKRPRETELPRWLTGGQTAIDPNPDDPNGVDEEITLTHDVGSTGDVAYNALPDVEVRLTVLDDADPGLRFSPDEIFVPVGGVAVYAVCLSVQPTALVTVGISITPDGGAVTGAAPDTLTFSPANWNAEQQVVVTAGSGDDVLNEAATLVHVASSTDADYNTLENAEMAVTVVDDDGSPGVHLIPDDISMDEGETVTYAARLGMRPTAPVTIDVTLGGVASTEIPPHRHPVSIIGTTLDGGVVRVTPITLTFTPENWSLEQHFTVYADFDDNAYDVEATLVHAISSTDAGYNALPDIEVELTATDDDESGLRFQPNGISVIEGETTEYAVRLSAQPTTAVTIDIGIIPDNGMVTGITPETLTFTPANWSVDQPVTVTIGSDDDARDEAATLVHEISGADIGYNALENVELGVTVVDNDKPGLYTPNEISVDEGRYTRYPARLSMQPTAPVTVDITLDGVHEYSRIYIRGSLVATGTTPDGVKISFTPETLTFTPENWDVDQYVWVTSRSNHGDDEAATLVHAISGADAGYDALEDQEVGITVVDDDTTTYWPMPGTIVGPPIHVLSEITVDEGRTATYGVSLEIPPTAPVTIAMRLVPDDGTITGLTPQDLTFIPEDWSQGQNLIVTVTAASDDDTYDHVMEIYLAASSDDEVYNDKGNTARIIVVDDDGPGLHLPRNAVLVNEGATATYSTHLNVPPTAPVTIGITPSLLEEVGVTPETFVFTPDNWSVDQHVTVTAHIDDDRYGEVLRLVHDISSADADYNALRNREVEVAVIDGDRRRLLDMPSEISVDEAGTTTYPVKLLRPPNAPVIVSMSPALDGGAVTGVIPKTLTFTQDNWNAGQRVTVTVGSDGDVLDESATIMHAASSDHGPYNALEDTLWVTVVDDDKSGLRFTPNELSINEGETATYSARLNVPPTAPVTIRVSSHGDDVTGITPETLTFTTGNWNVDRHVTFTVGDDSDSHHEGVAMRHFISSTDTNYNALGEKLVRVAVTDDDRQVPLLISPNGLSMNEGETATYMMRLRWPPATPVTLDISITPDGGEVAVTTPETLILTPGNWYVDRYVTITADSDGDRHSEMATIRHAVSSADTEYNALGAQEVVVEVIDHDRRSALFLPDDISVYEGETATYAVRLRSPPDAPITVDMNPAPDGGAVTGVTPESLTFTTENWNVDRYVTVTAGSDSDTLDEAAMIAHAISGGYASYYVLEDGLKVTVVDDDRPGLRLTPSEVSVYEGVTTMYAARLKVQPIAPVTVSIGTAPDGGAVTGVTPESLTFTTENWNVDRHVTVTVGSDGDTRDEAAMIVHDMSSDDYRYSGLEDRLKVTVVDDDDEPGPPLTANAGDDITDAKEKTTVTLDGTGSTFDESDAAMIRYLWARKQGDDGDADWLQLVDADQPQATFTVPNLTVGIDLTFVLTVTNDRTGNSDADEVTVTISATNDPPKADAGESRDEQEGTEVTLDGSGSSDPEGEQLRYAWRLKSGGSSYVTMPSDLTTAWIVVTLGVNIPDETELTFELRVTDPGDASHAADVVIKVRSTPFGEVLGHALSRFGRALGSSAVDTLGERFNNASRRTSGTVAVNVDGTQLNLVGGKHQGAAHIAGSPPDTPTSDAAMPGPLWANHFDERLRVGSRRLPAEGRDLLMRSDFEIGLGGDDGSGPDRVGADLREAEGSVEWAFWGRFDSRGFEATPTEAVALDGSVTVGYLGADARFGTDGEVIVGLALTNADSDVAFKQDGLEGDISLGMLGFYPYGGWNPSEAVSLWGMLGAGSGEAELTTDKEHALATDIGMMMLAGGGRGDLRSVGMVNLAVTGDAYLVNTEADGVANRALKDIETNVQRLRVGLEGSLQLPVNGASMLRPSLALSGRLDGGDAETGFGVEVNASIAYENAMGWTLDGRMRQLLTHTDDGIAETAFSAMLRYDPGGPGGPSIALAPTWGDMQSVAPAMWRGDAPMFGGLPGTGEVNDASASRTRSLNAELQYGIPLRSWMIAPYGTLNMHGASDRERWGVRIEALALPRGNLSADLFGERSDGRRGAAMDPGVQATVRLLLD